MICVSKLVTHAAEDANAESSTKSMNVEPSREIQSPSSNGTTNEGASKVHLFQDWNEIRTIVFNRKQYRF